MTIVEIATRLGRSPSTIAMYFSDPAGEKARRYKHKDRSRCMECRRSPAAKPGVKLCRACWRLSAR